MPEITIYTRKFCGFCSAAKKLLDTKNVKYAEFDGTFDPEIRKEMQKKSDGSCTFPQIFIGEKHVGGCDELYALEEAGDLTVLLEG